MAYALQPSASRMLPVCTDGELIQRTGAGDRTAFEKLYQRYARPVFGLALRRLGVRKPRTYFCDAGVVYFAAYARSTAVFKSSLRVRIARTGISRSPIFMTPRGSSTNA